MSKAFSPEATDPHDPVFRSIPHLFDPPEGWERTSSWKRAQQTTDDGGPINDAERMVSLDDSDGYHRVFWALRGGSLRCKCSCKGFQYRDWCAHVASLWWRWSRGRIVTNHVQTGRAYEAPPPWLTIGETPDVDLDRLTPAELDAYLTCELGDLGVREFARGTDRAPGTVGNLLRRARNKLEGGR